VISVPDALPITLVLAVLVSVFLSLERQAPVARVRLWAYAWSLTFLHFFARAMENQGGIVQTILTPVDFGALELSAPFSWPPSCLKPTRGRSGSA